MEMEQINETDAKSEQRAYARFYKRAVEDKAKTREAGRPICVVKDFIEIQTPGDKTNIVDRPVRDEDKQRFARQFAAYQVDKSQDEASGTLLSSWGGISDDRVEMFRFYKVMTVEQLAGMADFANFDAQARKDADRAKAFIEAAKGSAPLLQLQSAMAEKDKELAALREALRQQGDRLDTLTGKAPKLAPDEVSALVEAQDATVAPKKRGRPAKTAQAE